MHFERIIKLPIIHPILKNQYDFTTHPQLIYGSLESIILHKVRGDKRMIDWNNDGRVDPTEVVLTELVLDEPDEEDAFVEDEENVVYEKKQSWIERIFRRRKDVRK